MVPFYLCTSCGFSHDYLSFIRVLLAHVTSFDAHSLCPSALAPDPPSPQSISAGVIYTALPWNPLYQSPTLGSLFPGSSIVRHIWFIFILFSWRRQTVLVLDIYKCPYFRASLVAQWLGIRLPMQGTRVRAPVREDPTCRGAARPVSHNYWACASGTCAPQRERPRQWEARAPRWRVAPARRNWRKPSHRNEDPTQPKINK